MIAEDSQRSRHPGAADCVYAYDAADLTGGVRSIMAWKGCALLIVNTASKCGFTPQYGGLESLYRTYRERGLVVLGFPCDQFGHQEPGDGAEITNFCSLTYDVTFPMFAKIDVNGHHVHPLFTFLKRRQPGLLGATSIKWNFTKFLVDRTGRPVSRHAPTSLPQSLTRRIEALL